MSKTFHLPLFPLNTLVFPSQPILVRVFETRYRRLVTHCLENDAEFGLVLIREGLEVGGPAIPYSVGTTVRIVHHELDENGHIQLVVLGQRRFRIVDLLVDKPYPAAMAYLWPWEEKPTPSAKLMATVGARLRRYVGTLAGTVPAVLAADALPQEPTLLGVLASIVLQVSLTEKQGLLETPTAVDLLSRVSALLHLQTSVAEHVKTLRPVGPNDFERISWN